MSTFTPEELRKTEIAGLVIAVAGFIATLTVKLLNYPSEGFWVDHLEGLSMCGVIALITGIVVFAIAIAHRKTHFFSLEHKIDLEVFAITMFIIVVVMAVLLVLLFYKLGIDPKSMSPDPGARAVQTAQDRGFRGLVAFAIVLVAGIISYFPFRRFLRS